MKIIWSVLKKEFLNIIRNRRRLIMMVLFNLVVLPCLAIGPLIIVTRKSLQGAVQKLEIPVQGMEHAPGLFAYIDEKESMTFLEVEDVEKMVHERQAAAGLIIPVDFEKRIQDGESAQVTVVTDKSKSLNLEGTRLENIVEEYSQVILQERLEKNGISQDYLTPIQVEELNAATEQETTGSFLSLLIPGFIMTFALTGGLSIAISTVAGEKEGQTLEPVLFTPVSRTLLVFGKLSAVLANVIFAAIGFIFSILVSMLVFILVLYYTSRTMDFSSAPAAFTSSSAGSSPYLFDLTASLPGPASLVFFVLSILPILLLAAALQIMISTIARNSEEAFTFSIPLSILSLVPMLVAFMLDEFVPSLGHYAIPVFGTILSMRDLLSDHIFADSLTMMFVSSIGYATIMIGISVWMFNREEVVFRV